MAEGTAMLAGSLAATAHGLSFHSTSAAVQVNSGVCDSPSTAVWVCQWTV